VRNYACPRCQQRLHRRLLAKANWPCAKSREKHTEARLESSHQANQLTRPRAWDRVMVQLMIHRGVAHLRRTKWEVLDS